MTGLLDGQGRGDQRRRARAGHDAGAAMRRGRRRPGAGGPHRGPPRRGGQAGHRRRAGARWRCGTDITDDEQVANLVDGRHRGVRQGRRADQQRLPGAVDEAVGRHHFSTSATPSSSPCSARCGSPRASPRRWPRPTGSVVNVNSMVIRHSQAKYGAYKMAKSALLAMSQSLATELGEQGIRVNSVAARLHLGRHAAGLLRPPGRQVRHHGRRRSTRRPPRRTPTSSGCPPRTRWPRRSCSWPATCPAASPARPSTSTAGSTRPSSRDDRASRAIEP